MIGLKATSPYKKSPLQLGVSLASSSAATTTITTTIPVASIDDHDADNDGNDDDDDSHRDPTTTLIDHTDKSESRKEQVVEERKWHRRRRHHHFAKDVATDRMLSSFLQQFRSTTNTHNNTHNSVTVAAPNPIILLQKLYRETQSKHEPEESVKSWFHFKEWTADYETTKHQDHPCCRRCYNWTCYILVPNSLVHLWKVKSRTSSGINYHSGRIRLGKSVNATVVQKELLDLCGEWWPSAPTRASSGPESFMPAPTSSWTENDAMVRFKSKKGAEKSAALNLLFAIEMGKLNNGIELDETFIENNENSHLENAGLEKLSLPNCHILRDEGEEEDDDNDVLFLQLNKLRYYGKVLNYEDDDQYLSRGNPCKVQCVASVFYSIAKNGDKGDCASDDGDDGILEVSSDWCNDSGDSMHDAFEKLKCKIREMSMPSTLSSSSSSSTSSSLHHDNHEKVEIQASRIFSEMTKRSKSAIISCEETLPMWATAKIIESKIYLHQLEFSVVTNQDTKQEGEDISDTRLASFPNFMELDDDVATRVGIICGCASLEAGLSADFEWPCIADDDGQHDILRVAITKSTTVLLSDMMQQIDRISPAVQLEEGECPVSLAKCFNKLIFDYGKQYGMGPKPSWNELLHAVTKGNNVAPGNSRTYMFVPLLPKPQESDANPSVDWQVMYDVVHQKSTTLVDAAFSSHLLNRFLMQPTGFGGRVFVAKRKVNGTETPLSHLLSMNMSSTLSDQTKEKLRTAFLGCEPSNITHVQYYEQIHRYSIRHPALPLVATQSLSGMTYEQHEMDLIHHRNGMKPMAATIVSLPRDSISNILTARGFLVPELIHILPLPRDFLYLCRRASSFMPKLERAHTLRVVASKLQPDARMTPRTDGPVSTDNFLSLIDKATSRGIINTTGKAIVKRDHERLETLGDAVLLHFIVLNLFARLPSTQDEFVLDLFERVISMQGKNEILSNAAMQIGLHRLIHFVSESTSSWKSNYESVRKVSCTGAIDIAQKQLSDTVESIIGATYLADLTGSMTVRFLNQIGPDFPAIDDSDGSSRNDAIGWFVARGTCLEEGFPFKKHSTWVDELEQIQEITNSHPDIHSTLQRNTAGFLRALGSRASPQHDKIEILKTDPIALLLVHAALFDDSLDDQQYNHDGSDTTDLEKIAQLRDKIFNVGNAALQLSIVSEIYHMYQESTSGDFQLMKSALMSHDALAYIFVTNEFHTFLFDACAADVMQEYTKEADSLGGKEWRKNGGWVIPGGVEEFRKRIHLRGGEELANPRYSGLAAGRLMGHRKKLPTEATEDLQFSMKCIVGAITLISGVHGAWDLFRPFFLELLVLSPEEMRTSFKEVSDLASNYQKGKR